MLQIKIFVRNIFGKIKLRFNELSSIAQGYTEPQSPREHIKNPFRCQGGLLCNNKYSGFCIFSSFSQCSIVFTVYSKMKNGSMTHHYRMQI